jgi:hypothetical protein
MSATDCDRVRRAGRHLRRPAPVHTHAELSAVDHAWTSTFPSARRCLYADLVEDVLDLADKVASVASAVIGMAGLVLSIIGLRLSVAGLRATVDAREAQIHRPIPVVPGASVGSSPPYKLEPVSALDNPDFKNRRGREFLHSILLLDLLLLNWTAGGRRRLAVKVFFIAIMAAATSLSWLAIA